MDEWVPACLHGCMRAHACITLLPMVSIRAIACCLLTISCLHPTHLHGRAETCAHRRGREPHPCAHVRTLASTVLRLLTMMRTASLRTKILDFRGFDSSRMLKCKGWNSHVQREFPGSSSQRIESTNLSRDKLIREIGRTRHGACDDARSCRSSSS